jgi:hypothetical protein
MARGRDHRRSSPGDGAAGRTAPSALRIVAGLYTAATGQRLASDLGEAVTLGEVLVLSDADALPGATHINFDDKLALVGFQLDRRVVTPGETVAVTLWWEGLAPMAQDYVVFVHLLLPPDTVWAQQDQMPQAGAARTSTWQVGDRIADTHSLTLPPESPPASIASKSASTTRTPLRACLWRSAIKVWCWRRCESNHNDKKQEPAQVWAGSCLIQSLFETAGGWGAAAGLLADLLSSRLGDGALRRSEAGSRCAHQCISLAK